MIQAFPRFKIWLLNLNIHQFSYSEQPIHLKRYLKRSLCIEFKENPLSYFSSRESLLKLKIVILNLNLHQCFCSKRLFYLKRHLKGNYCMLFEEKHSSSFSSHVFPKSKIGIPNLDFNKFFCLNQLIDSGKHVNRCLFIEFKVNR